MSVRHLARAIGLLHAPEQQALRPPVPFELLDGEPACGSEDGRWVVGGPSRKPPACGADGEGLDAPFAASVGQRCQRFQTPLGPIVPEGQGVEGEVDHCHIAWHVGDRIAHARGVRQPGPEVIAQLV